MSKEIKTYIDKTKFQFITEFGIREFIDVDRK